MWAFFWHVPPKFSPKLTCLWNPYSSERSLLLHVTKWKRTIRELEIKSMYARFTKIVTWLGEWVVWFWFVLVCFFFLFFSFGLGFLECWLLLKWTLNVQVQLRLTSSTSMNLSSQRRYQNLVLGTEKWRTHKSELMLLNY